MRIDDPYFIMNHHLIPPFESNFSYIDRLISEIKIDENNLRNRKNNIPKYISSPDLDDIDDVIINIDVPPNITQIRNAKLWNMI